MSLQQQEEWLWPCRSNQRQIKTNLNANHPVCVEVNHKGKEKNANEHSKNKCFSSSDGILYDKAKTTLLHCSVGKEGAVEIPSGVTHLGDSAFEGCDSLREIRVVGDVEKVKAVLKGSGVDFGRVTFVQVVAGL